MSQIIQVIAISAIPILFAVTLHEAAHGWVADKRGDPTAKRLGRLTLNPLAHVDIMGTVIVPILLIISRAGFVFGWAKPVPVNFLNLKRPKEDMILVAAAGPATNLVLALGCGILFRIIVGLKPEMMVHICPSSMAMTSKDVSTMLLTPLLLMLSEGVKWNVILAVFNMIPIPPLDGGRVLVGLLPERQSATLSSIEPFGFVIILALFFIDPFDLVRQIIMPFMFGTMSLIGGQEMMFVTICRMGLI